MADMDSFTLIDPSSSRHNVFDDYVELHNGHAFDPLTSYTEFLKRHYPELTVTVTSANNGDLIILTQSELLRTDEWYSQSAPICCIWQRYR